MKKPWLVVLVMLIVIPSLVLAQRGRGGGRGGGGRGGNGGKDNGGPAKEETTDSRPTKPADLTAVSITAKWKDAKTLVVTATLKNAGPGIFMGTRTAVLKITGKDGKPEVAKEETLPGIAVAETHTVTFETTDKKYFDKDLKWTLELTPADNAASNDKKTTTLSPGPQPKG
jgi:hypothetical protein